MKESVVIAKEADTMSSPTKSDKSIHCARNEPERQLSTLRGVIDNIRRDGGAPSVESIATELSGMYDAQRASALLGLQRTHGNQYVQRVVAGIQAKLKVGQPGDIYELEADRVADAVMRMPEPQVRRQTEKGEKKEEKLIQTQPLTKQITSLVQRQVEGEEERKVEELLQTKTVPGQTPEVAPDLESHIQVLRVGGHPLSESARAFFEPRFGYDFSQVCVHTDAWAAESTQALNARAYTVGRNIFFNFGEYEPMTTPGKRLLGHELAHVVQQETGRALRQYAMIGDKNGDLFERAGEEATGNALRRWPITAQSLAPFDVQCAAPTKTPTCGPVELFSEIDMPWPVPNNYFRGSRWMKEGEWKAALNAARKGKCEAKGEFEDIKLRWNLGNPRLDSYWGMDLNENDIKFDINPRVIYAGEPCGPCFTGTASWSFNVEVSRKKGKTIERGKTKTPIKGSITGEKCDGKKCCAVGQTMKVNMALGDTDISAKIRGEVRITGATYSD